MKKTHKKIDNQLRQALTSACEEIKDTFEKFSWLTHEVNFDNYPQSLQVHCYFVNYDSMLECTEQRLDNDIGNIIKSHLEKIKIVNFSPSKQVYFDIEN